MTYFRNTKIRISSTDQKLANEDLSFFQRPQLRAEPVLGRAGGEEDSLLARSDPGEQQELPQPQGWQPHCPERTGFQELRLLAHIHAKPLQRVPAHHW